MSVEIEKYKQAWEKFQNKIASLKKRRSEILENIYKKFDEQLLESVRKKIKEHGQRTSNN